MPGLWGLGLRHEGRRLAGNLARPWLAEAARRLRREVAIATGTLAELYRRAGRNQALDALLARESGDGLLLRDTDRTLARLIGALLAEAHAGSALFADAHPIAGCRQGQLRYLAGPRKHP